MMLKTLVAGTSIQNEIIALKALEQRQALQGLKTQKSHQHIGKKVSRMTEDHRFLSVLRLDHARVEIFTVVSERLFIN